MRETSSSDECCFEIVKMQVVAHCAPRTCELRSHCTADVSLGSAHRNMPNKVLYEHYLNDAESFVNSPTESG
eukprot:6212800-Pleurochrysis_carterae.AAC.5